MPKTSATLAVERIGGGCLEGGLKMENPRGSSECSKNDLTGRKSAWLLWYLPIVLVIIGSSWNRGRAWLWVPASRDGHRLLSKRNAVRSNPLLCRCAIVSSCRCFRGFVRTGHRCAAPRSVPPRRIRRVQPRVLCRGSVSIEAALDHSLWSS
jgi:hypothetical protein